MNLLCLTVRFSVRWLSIGPVRLMYLLAVAGLVGSCQVGSVSSTEQLQADNVRLTKTLHAHLNRRDWPAVEKLCAETVRYRSRTTHFADIDEPKATFLAHYRTTLNADQPGSLQIRQMYPAGAYHVIIEGIAPGEPPDTTRPVCLIYTIEDAHITRLYAY